MLEKGGAGDQALGKHCSKGKRTVLSLKNKVEILEALKKGESGSSLKQKYGVCASTISAMKKQGDAIRNYANKFTEEAGCSERKVMRTSRFEQMEEALYVWFLQNRTAGNPISGPLLCEKALFFNARFGDDRNFKASQGWLDNFKKRHGIRSRDFCGEKLSADEASADSFREELKKILEEEGYDADFVYNADETGLNWKALPNQSLVARHEENAPGYKARKERVTVMLCANSTGLHRLPLFLIGKAKKPRSFRGAKSLPVVYGHQKKAWMTVHLFQDWLEKLFIPEVKWHLDYIPT